MFALGRDVGLGGRKQIAQRLLSGAVGKRWPHLPKGFRVDADQVESACSIPVQVGSKPDRLQENAVGSLREDFCVRSKMGLHEESVGRSGAFVQFGGEMMRC